MSVKTTLTFNRDVLDRYKGLTLYIEPKEEEVLGSFLVENESQSSECNQNLQRSTTTVTPSRRKGPPKPI